AVNLNDLRLTVTRVYDGNLVAWRNAPNRQRWSDPTAYSRPVVSTAIQVPKTKNVPQDVRVSLDELLPPDAPRDGVYRVTIGADETAPRHRGGSDRGDDDIFSPQYGYPNSSAMVTLSDIGLSAKQGRDGV